MLEKLGSWTRWVRQWVGRREPFVLLGFLIVVTGTWGLVELAEEVGEGETRSFDHWVLRTLRSPDSPNLPIGPRWLPEVARDITALGGISVLVLVTIAVAGFLVLARRYRMSLFLLFAVSTGTLLTSFLKRLFDRPRPDIVPHLTEVATSSFPSGHSMMAAVVYVTLGTLLSSVLRRRRLKIYVLTLALGTAGLVGLTRIYLGVHYPTDVLAGWTAGLVWALGCWLVAQEIRNLQRDLAAGEKAG